MEPLLNSLILCPYNGSNRRIIVPLFDVTANKSPFTLIANYDIPESFT